MKIGGIFLAGFLIGGALWYIAAQQEWFGGEERSFNAGDRQEQTDTSGAAQEQESADVPSSMQESADGDSLVGDALPPQSSTRVAVSDQAGGSVVVIDEVVMPEAGWVVVHEMRDGHIGNALGAGRVREAGDYSDFEVPLLRSTGVQERYIVVLYSDNGNGEFDINVDLPIVDAFGEAMVAEFETIAQ